MHESNTRQQVSLRNTKHQTPNTREAPSSKFQARNAGRGLKLGTWDFFAVWSLVFGVSIPASSIPLLFLRHASEVFLDQLAILLHDALATAARQFQFCVFRRGQLFNAG